MSVEAPPGTTMGGIKAEYKFLLQSFSVINGDGEKVLKIVKGAGQFFSPEVDLRS